MAASLILEKHSRVVPSDPSHARIDYCDLDKSAAGMVFTEGNPDYVKEESTKFIRRSRSLLSASSLRLLSGCSSLESLVSLGLGVQEPSDSLLEAEIVCLETLIGYGEQIVVSDDGLTLYSASSSSAGVRRVEASSSCYKIESDGSSVISREKPPVRAMAAMGDLLFCAHSDLKIRVWEKDTLRQMAALPTAMDCIRRGLLPAAYVQVRRHQRRRLWMQHVDAICALALSRREGLLYSASWDRSVKVWRMADFKCVETFRAHDDAVNALLAVDDGTGELYTGSADGTIKSWARGEGRNRKHSLAATLTAHRSAVNALAISRDGGLLYSGAGDKAIVVWERGACTGARLAGALRGHRHAVLCLAIAGPSTLCSGSADKTIRLWHRLAGPLHTCLATLDAHSAPIRSLAVSAPPSQPALPADGLADSSLPASATFSLYSAALDKEVKLWRITLSATASDAHHVNLDALQPALLQGGPFSSR